MTERVWGVVGPENVFSQAPSQAKAELWANYSGGVSLPIKGEVAYREGGIVFSADGDPLALVEEPTEPS